MPMVARLLAATILARLASRMLILVIILFALERFHSAALIGWLTFATFAPGLAASPLIGALLDRIGGVRGIMIDMIISAGLVGLMAAMGFLGIASAPLLLVLTAGFSLTSPLSAAGIRVLLPSLLQQAALDRANALDMMVHAAVEVVGPALGGLLVAFAGGPETLLLIATLYAAASICLHGMPRGDEAARRARTRKGQAPLLAEAAGSFGIVARSPTLRGLVVSYSLYQLTWGILLVAVPVVIDGTIEANNRRDLVIGLVWAGSGLAGGVGALLAGLIGQRDQERRVIAMGMLATALAIYPLSITGLLGLTLAMAATGFLSGPIDVGLLTLRQRHTEPACLGRVLTVSMSLNLSGLPIGSALGGFLASSGWHAPFAIAALAAAVGAIACHVMIPPGDDPAR